MHQSTRLTMQLVPPSNLSVSTTASVFNASTDWKVDVTHVTLTAAVSCSSRLRTWDRYFSETQ